MLRRGVRAAVNRFCKKLTEEIDVFGGGLFLSPQGLFWGFREAWAAENELDWEKIFNFTENISSEIKSVF